MTLYNKISFAALCVFTLVVMRVSFAAEKISFEDDQQKLITKVQRVVADPLSSADLKVVASKIQAMINDYSAEYAKSGPDFEAFKAKGYRSKMRSFTSSDKEASVRSLARVAKRLALRMGSRLRNKSILAGQGLSSVVEPIAPVPAPQPVLPVPVA